MTGQTEWTGNVKDSGRFRDSPLAENLWRQETRWWRFTRRQPVREAALRHISSSGPAVIKLCEVQCEAAARGPMERVLTLFSYDSSKKSHSGSHAPV